MFEIHRLIFKNQTFSLKFKKKKNVQNLSFYFQSEVLEFQQFNFEIQKIKFTFHTFMF